MICPKCGSDDWILKNYDSYTDEFVYECGYCGSIVRRCDTETISTNKSITADKITINDMQYDDYRVYNVERRCPKCGSVMYYKTDGQLHCDECEKNETSSINGATKMCPNCGSPMMLQTNGSFVCPKCKTYSLYTTKDIKMTVSKSLLPNEVNITAEKITIVDKTIGIQIDISKQILDNTDTIVINGVKYVKESSPENSTVSLADIDKAINTMSNLDYLNRVIIPKLWDIKSKKVKDENIQSIKNDTNFVMNLLRTIRNERTK